MNGKFNLFNMLVGSFATIFAMAFTEAASPPIPQNLMSPTQAVVGTPITVSVAATDVDANLSSIIIYYRDMNGSTGPWISLGSASVSGSFGEHSVNWTPPTVGDFELHAGVYDTGGLHHGNAGVVLVNPIEVVDDAPIPEIIEHPRIVIQNETYRITGSGSDADGNLKELRLYYDAPTTGFSLVPITNWLPSNGDYYGTISADWTPTMTGTYLIHIAVRDHDGQTHDSHELGSIWMSESFSAGSPIPPFPENLSTPTTGYVDEAIYLSARATDLNGDLDYMQFYVDFPTSGTTWVAIGEPVPVSGSDDTAGLIWKPSSSGTHSIHIGVFDESGLDHEDNTSGNYWLSNTISISGTPPGVPPPSSTDDFVIQGTLVIDTGEEYDVVHDANVATSGTVTIQNDGSSIVWASGKVTLGQGFTASPGTSGSFAVTIDSDMDGRSDLVENVDSDGDGILDGYEYEIIDYSLFDSIDTLAEVSGSGDFDGDGITNAAEIAAGTSPAGLEGGQSTAYANLLVLPIPESPDYRVVEIGSLLSD